MTHFYTPSQLSQQIDIASDFSKNAYAAGDLSGLADVQLVGMLSERGAPISCHLSARAEKAFLRYAPEDYGQVIADMSPDDEAMYWRAIARLIYRNVRVGKVGAR